MGARDLAIFLALVPAIFAQPVQAGNKINVHSHVQLSGSSASAADLVSEMATQQISFLFLMGTPAAFPSEADEGDDTEDLVAAFSAYPQIKYFYGGTELNPLLHAVGRTTDWTVESLYPNGVSDSSSAQAEIDETVALASDSATLETEFKALAESAASSGLYKGFGEIAPLHYSQRSDHPQIEFSASHAWLLWLSDLAATNNMVLDLHLEATDESLVELRTLLAHNSATKIIWEH
ncbi:MAG: hypothetical protein AAB425_13590, partial [Bdellovibrionota bacterium]